MVALGELVAAVEREGFALALRAMLRSVVRFDTLVISRFPKTGAPECLFHDLDDVQAAITVDFYATGPFLLDPFYLACCAGRAPGVFRLRDLAPPAFLRSEYYRRFYRRTRLSDEIGLLLPAAGGGWLILSLARGVRGAAFGEADLGGLRGLAPVVAAAVGRHWGTGGESESAGRDLAQARLAFFGTEQLSPREAEVIQMVLQGHSTPGIAALLGLAAGTVKVHRRHAYAKLGISSQAELFSMATRYLTVAPD